jgi:Putative phage tail protein
MSGGGSSSSSVEPALGSLKVQTSTYGTAIPVVFGRTKISGNLGWYNGFKSKPDYGESAGKGGDGEAAPSGYTYTADVLMFLGEGAITNVRTVWQGKSKRDGSSAVGGTNREYNFPLVGPGFVGILPNSSAVTGVYSVIAINQGYGEPDAVLAEGRDFTRVQGVLSFSNSLTIIAANVFVSYSVDESAVSALSESGLLMKTGTLNQQPFGQISSTYPSEALSYAGLAYVVGLDYRLGSDGSVENHQFEVDGALQNTGIFGLPDASPAAVIENILTSPRHGVGFDASLIQGLANYSTYCIASGLVVSPAYTSQITARDAIDELLKATNSIAVFTGDALRFLPLGDESITANYVSFVANNTVAFDLGPNDFKSDGGAAVTIKRKPLSERFNRVVADFLNRANNYNSEPAIWEDDAAIIRDGINAEQSFSWEFFCDGEAVQKAVTLYGQRKQAQRAEYEFTLWWRYLALEQGDLVRISDPLGGIQNVVVRVLSITENPDDSLAIVAEDCPLGNASVAVNSPQLGSGFSPNTNIDPGSVVTPAFIEPPGGQTATGLEVWVAASGVGRYWGGCDVYTSLDGSTYKIAGRIERGARYGTLTAAVGVGSGVTMLMQLAGKGGQLISVSAAAAAAQESLCYVGSATTGEYLSFQGSTLTGTNAYSLTGLVRGQNATTDSSKINGDKFVFVDDSMGKSGPLDRSLVGKVIYFKLASFNVFGGGRQSLASVPAYTYTITGRFMDQLGQPVTKANSGLGIVGNLVANSGWKYNALGWEDFSGATSDYHLNKLEDTANAITSSPRNFVLYQGGSNASQFQYEASPKFSVSEGQRYGFACDVLNIQSASCGAYLDFADINGNYMSSSVVAVGPATGGSPTNASDYKRVGNFAIAPAGARSARIIIYKQGTLTGTESYAWFRRPTVCIAGPVQTDLPDWDSGLPEGVLSSLNTADTANLSPNSATVLSQVSNNIGSQIIGSFQTWQTVVQVTVLNDSPDAASIELTSSVRQFLNAGPNGFIESQYRFFVLQTSQIFGSTFGSKQDANSSSSALVPVIGSVSIPAGATYTIQAQVYFDGAYVGFWGTSTIRAALVKR